MNDMFENLGQAFHALDKARAEIGRWPLREGTQAAAVRHAVDTALAALATAQRETAELRGWLPEDRPAVYFKARRAGGRRPIYRASGYRGRTVGPRGQLPG